MGSAETSRSRGKNSGTAAHKTQQSREKKTVQPQTEEQHGKRACAVTARGLISRASVAQLRVQQNVVNWTTALIPWSSGKIQLGAEAASHMSNWHQRVLQDPLVSDKNIWMLSLPSQVKVRKGNFSETSTSSQSSGPQEISRKNVASYPIRSSYSKRETNHRSAGNHRRDPRRTHHARPA